jgi:hypothetical protein
VSGAGLNPKTVSSIPPSPRARPPPGTRAPPQLAYPSTSYRKQEYLQWRKAMRKGPPGPSRAPEGRDIEKRDARSGTCTSERGPAIRCPHYLVSLPSCRRRLPSAPGGHLRFPRRAGSPNLARCLWRLKDKMVVLVAAWPGPDRCRDPYRVPVTLSGGDRPCPGTETVVPVDRYDGELSGFCRGCSLTNKWCTHSRNYVWRSARVAPDLVSEGNRMGRMILMIHARTTSCHHPAWKDQICMARTR